MPRETDGPKSVLYEGGEGTSSHPRGVAPLGPLPRSTTHSVGDETMQSGTEIGLVTIIPKSVPA